MHNFMKDNTQNQYKETILVEIKNSNPTKDINLMNTLFFPSIIGIASIVVSVVLSKFLKSKKEKTETEKINQEINNLKKNYQPFVFDTLNRIGNELLPRKVKLLENLLRIKSDFFDFENSYYEGQSSVDDVCEYYQIIARNMNKSILDDFNRNVNQEVYYFHSEIIKKINSLSSEFYKLTEYESYQISLRNPDVHPDAENCVLQITELFKDSIELIRQDLQIDNRYIQNFLNHYNKIE
jgi:hypothetical protein